MALNIKSFQTLVQDQAAAIQSRALAVIDFAVGAVMRALIEANASIGLWLQSLIVQVLTLTRAATSSGSDLDSFFADFNFPRLGGTFSTGTVTFSRFTATAAGFVAVGAQVQTADGTQTATVIASTSAGFDADLNGYPLAVGVSSLAIPVQANNKGSVGNVAAGTITVIFGSIPGIDLVSNAAAMTGGVDAETDGAYRARFVLFLAAKGGSTPAAAQSAVAALQVGVTSQVVENQNLDGTPRNAFYFVVVDDGTGAPSAAFLAAATAAVEAVRPAGINAAVFGPTIVTAAVSMQIAAVVGFDLPTVEGIVAAALTKFINSLTLGQPLPFSRLTQIAYDASPGVTNVTGVLLNGATADLVTTPAQVIKPATIAVN